MCEKFDILMAAYAGGQLLISESRRFELHLELCRACRSKTGQMRDSKPANLAPADDIAFERLRETLAEPVQPPSRKSALRGALPWSLNA